MPRGIQVENRLNAQTRFTCFFISRVFNVLIPPIIHVSEALVFHVLMTPIIHVNKPSVLHLLMSPTIHVNKPCVFQMLMLPIGGPNTHE